MRQGMMLGMRQGAAGEARVLAAVVALRRGWAGARGEAPSPLPGPDAVSGRTAGGRGGDEQAEGRGRVGGQLALAR
jgi:hypothetical protein